MSQEIACLLRRPGAVASVPCPPGTFQDFFGQSKCKPCPERYYCDGKKRDKPIDCPAGFYCPEKTKWKTEYPCPIGTYSPGTKRKTVDECLPCPTGSYCEARGLSAPTDDCEAVRSQGGTRLPRSKIESTNDTAQPCSF